MEEQACEVTLSLRSENERTDEHTLQSAYCDANNWCKWADEHGLDGVYRYEMSPYVQHNLKSQG